MRKTLEGITKAWIVLTVIVSVVLFEVDTPIMLIVSTVGSLVGVGLIIKFMAEVLEWLEIIANLIAKKK